MLAYLDDILEPGDAEELSQKIEESKFASELVHRIRSSTRRLRLGAPKLEGRGMGLDPNTVAEYLDNTLPTENVPDFEKVCLESDVHLAEVASCHQILALVLGEPAAIDQSVRDRAYRIGQPGSEDGSSPLGTDGVNPAVADPLADMPVEEGEPPMETDLPEKPAPDYMKIGPRISLRSLAITLVCAFALAVVALRAMHPFNQDHPVFQFFDGGGDRPVAQAPKPAPASPAKPPVIPAEKAPAKPEPPAQEPAAAEPQTTTETPPPKPEPPAKTAAPAESPDAPPAAPEPPLEPPEKPEMPVPSPAEIAAPEEIAPAAPVEAAKVGRFISDDDVLGRLDPESGSWFRLDSNAPLAVGDRLIVLPTFRPQALFSGNVKVTFSGPARVELAAEVAPETPHLVFDFGRTVIVSVGDEGARAHLDLAGRQGVVVLPDAESALAVEVTHYLTPGQDPLSDAAISIVGLYATSGQITWSEASEEPVTIEAGKVLVLTGEDAPELLETVSPPEWFDGRALSQLERGASADLKTHLTADRPLSLSLLERTEFRRIEVAVLACRCLSYLGDFEPLLAALDGERHYSYWDGHYDALRSALARSPATANEVLESLEKTHADDAEDLFRMLWSYSPEQLEAGEAEKLVGLLEHKSMIARVLALENLRRITGKTLQFRPEETPGQEKSKVARWRRDLEDGLIRYKNPPAEMPQLGVSEGT
jgi:hypothetical protein